MGKGKSKATRRRSAPKVIGGSPTAPSASTAGAPLSSVAASAGYGTWGPLTPELQQAAENYNTKAEQIVTKFLGKFETVPAPARIYHYTDGTGLRGILQAGQLWFSDIFNLNDPSELRYGVEPAKAIFYAEATSASVVNSPEVQRFANNLSAMLAGGIEEVAHLFVCCFSSADDDLGQWRAYADNGRGFAMGFDGPMLENGFAKPGGVPVVNNMTFPVTYGDIQLRAIQTELIREVIPAILHPRRSSIAVHGRILDTFWGELLITLALQILRAALFFKHGAYTNEAEYRFMQLFQRGPVPDLRYRSRPYSLVRFREFDWRRAAPNALKEIVIGPAADKRITERFVSDCLRAFQPGGGVLIRPSDIPYRVP